MPRKHTMPCLAAVIAALMVFGALPLTAQAVTPFTIVALPDTQNYTLSYPATLTAQTQWIATNKSTLNIAFVTEEGDLSNNASAAEYDNANTSFNLLNGVVPYSVVPGNHDSNPTLFKDHFGPSRYTAISGSSSWYMGSSADVAGGDGLSFAQKFSAGGYNFLHLGLKYNAGADATTVSWAQNIMANNSGLPTIITTHSYMNADATGSYTGEAPAIWSNFVNNYSQVFMVLCGHMHGEAKRIDTDAASKKVIGMLADYQSYTNGGNGYLRQMTFDPDNNKIDVKTYSPTLNQYETDANSQFSWSVTFGANNAVTVNGLYTPPPPPVKPTIAKTLFNEPATGATSYAGSATELGFTTTMGTPASGGTGPQIGVTAAKDYVMLSKNVADLAFGTVSLSGYKDVTASIDVKVLNTGYEANSSPNPADSIHAWVTNGAQSIDLLFYQSTAINGIADDAYRTYTADIPAGWTQATMHVSSFSNSSVSAEGYYIDNVSFNGNPVPEPSTLVLLAVGALAALWYAIRRRK